MSSTTLHRNLNLPLLAFYGLGSIVGAGIYVLIGEVAGVAGYGIVWSFLLAGLIALLTGLTYAELSSRFPQSAGAALFVDIAFGNPLLTKLVALMLVVTGVVSSATICNGFVGYFRIFFDLPESIIIVGLCCVMCTIAAWGIRESAWVIAVITLLEVGGLLMVIFVTMQLDPIAGIESLNINHGIPAIVAGAFLAFYAFIGFEDMVNVAEEVHDAERTMPRGILLAVVLSVLLYLVIAVVVVRYVDPAVLGESASPLVLMVGHEPLAVRLITAISLLAVINGALVQIIMCARVLFGMSVRGLLPAMFSKLSPVTRTPVLNTVLISLAVMILALGFSLVSLAKATSTLMLLIFAVVSLSLIRIRRSSEDRHAGFKLPIIIPVISFLAAVFMLIGQF